MTLSLKKRLTLGFPTIVLLLLLTACAPAGGQSQDWDENILIYAALAPDHINREAIDQFNRRHTDVQIEIREYFDAESRKRLLVEMMAGQIPDILDMRAGAGRNEYRLPYKRLAQLGYLEDLWPYIETDFGRDGVLEKPLQAAEIDGGLYMVFSSVNIETLVGDARIVGDRTSWSFADLQKSFAAMPEGSTILEFCYRKNDLFNYILSPQLDSYIDWDTGRCFFDGENFRSALEFLNSFPTEFEWTFDEEVNSEISFRMQNGLQMLSLTSIDSLDYMKFIDARYAGHAAFVGYPMEDGSIGSYFRISGAQMSISSACRNKEAAWDFVRQMLFPKYSQEQLRAQRTLTCFPVNQTLYNRANRADMDREAHETMLFYNGPLVEVQPATEDDLHHLDAFINSIERIDLFDSEVYNIVFEQVQPYFAGDKTLDETVDLIQRRVTLYVNESR